GGAHLASLPAMKAARAPLHTWRGGTEVLPSARELGLPDQEHSNRSGGAHTRWARFRGNPGTWPPAKERWAPGRALAARPCASRLCGAAAVGASPRPGTIALASTSYSPVADKGNGNSRLVSISADGTRVAFESEATNLDPRDRDPGLDVYVKDVKTGRIIL